MRYIEETKDFVIFCCGKAALVYFKRNYESKLLNLPVSDATSSSESKAVCLQLSPDKKYLAVACESKNVSIWCTQTWTHLYTHKILKRPMSIAITSDSNTLLVADKTGDVYQFPLKGDNESEKEDRNSAEKAEPESLLGHLSMLLDLAVTVDNRYVITCDRDEKIRVSHYPNSYSIHGFCLGHTEFVTQVHLLPGKQPLLLSCSGDGTIKLWNFLKGNIMSSINTHDHTSSLVHHFEEYCQQKVEDSEDAKRFLPDLPAAKHFSVDNSNRYVAVVIDRIPAILLYKIEDEKLQYVSTADTKEILPYNTKWLVSGELLVEQNNVDQPLGVFEMRNDTLTALNNHSLITLGQKHKESFRDGRKELSIDILYKQRYDNVADYLKKKQERLETEKAVEAAKRLKV